MRVVGMTGNWLSKLIFSGLLVGICAGWLVVAICSQPHEPAPQLASTEPPWVRTADGWERAWWLVEQPRQLHVPPVHPALATAGIACAALAALVGSKRFSWRA
jgi:hypothetical protein